MPFDTRLHAKAAYWGIVDPTHLPGYGLKFSLAGITGPSSQQVWTITATNGNAGPAYNTLINNFTLKQISGRPCSPVITPPGGSYPVSIGDIPTGGSASASFTINLSSCNPSARFTLTVPWSSATYETGTFLWPASDQNKGGSENSNEQ